MTGQRVGHYEILEKIGSGGMGEVFRARDERLDREVAVKLIRPSSSENADHIRRFEQEARAAAALNHPNIVAIYDVGFDNGHHYIVSELLEGQTLRQRLLDGPLSPRQAADFALQIAQALVAAHERRIVHRDLKPENLFITREGRIKVLDFGVAKLQSASGEGADAMQAMTTVTKSGAVIGTVAYMSPEQLRGKGVDHRSDIFSLGAILYEMLAGKRAFAGETEVDTITAVLREEPAEINVEGKNIPPAFQEITRHCLEKDPEKRFQSARDLAFALQTLSNSSDTRTFRAFSKKSRTAKMLPWIAAAVLVAVGLVLLGEQLRPAPSHVTYRQLTFEQGTIYSARFARDGQEIIYTGAWNGKPEQLFSTVGSSLLPQPLQIANADLLSVSPTNELAIAVHPVHGSHLDLEKATLAEAPMAAASPREILQDVTAADWGANGQMAVVHHAEGTSKLEYPIGQVLYQTSGAIAHICISPRADQIAFMNHPDPWDDRGTVNIVDMSGNVRALTQEWESEDGLSWSPDGKEIWFTATNRSETRSLWAVDLAGHVRSLLDLPASLTLQDVVSDGRVLLTLNTIRLGMDLATLKDADEIDLSWHDWNVAKDISRDGDFVLFEDSSDIAGPAYAIAMRQLNSELPVRLGDGVPGGLSPDGKWAIAISQLTHPPKVSLIPLEAGQPRPLNIGDMENVLSNAARFLPDGTAILLTGNEPDHGTRCYLVSLNPAPIRPITPEGVTCGAISPDGQRVIGLAGDNSFSLYSINGTRAPQPVKIDHDFNPVQWGQNNIDLFGYRRGEMPVRVYRLDIATGQATVLKQLKASTSPGVFRIAPVVISRDGKRFLYSYNQTLSTLWLVSGLR